MEITCPQCSICLLRKKCDYIKSIRKSLKGQLPTKLFHFKCDQYGKIFLAGDVVNVRFTTKSKVSNSAVVPLEEPELIEGKFTGIISGVVYKNKYEVKFPTPVDLTENDCFDFNEPLTKCWRISKHIEPTGQNIYSK